MVMAVVAAAILEAAKATEDACVRICAGICVGICVGIDISFIVVVALITRAVIITIGLNGVDGELAIVLGIKDSIIIII